MSDDELLRAVLDELREIRAAQREQLEEFRAYAERIAAINETNRVRNEELQAAYQDRVADWNRARAERDVALASGQRLSRLVIVGLCGIVIAIILNLGSL